VTGGRDAVEEVVAVSLSECVRVLSGAQRRLKRSRGRPLSVPSAEIWEVTAGGLGVDQILLPVSE